MNKLYAFRGWILGLMAVALLAFPVAPFPSAVQVQPDADLSATLMPLVPYLAAAILLAFSVILRVQARRSIGEHTRGYFHDADRLVTDGIYSRIRHPLYVSNTGVGLSFVLFHLGVSPVALAFAVALVGYEVLLSRLEDAFLRERFRDQWTSWAKATPAFIPRRCHGNTSALKRPSFESVETERPRRSFARAFMADGSTWFWLCVTIALLTLRKFF